MNNKYKHYHYTIPYHTIPWYWHREEAILFLGLALGQFKLRSFTWAWGSRWGQWDVGLEWAFDIKQFWGTRKHDTILTNHQINMCINKHTSSCFHRKDVNHIKIRFKKSSMDFTGTWRAVKAGFFLEGEDWTWEICWGNWSSWSQNCDMRRQSVSSVFSSRYWVNVKSHWNYVNFMD